MTKPGRQHLENAFAETGRRDKNGRDRPGLPAIERRGAGEVAHDHGL